MQPGCKSALVPIYPVRALSTSADSARLNIEPKMTGIEFLGRDSWLAQRLTQGHFFFTLTAIPTASDLQRHEATPLIRAGTSSSFDLHQSIAQSILEIYVLDPYYQGAL